MRYIFIVFIFFELFHLQAKAEDKLFDLEKFGNKSFSDQERLDAIFHVRDSPYLKNQKAIDDFVSRIELDCENFEGRCCEIEVLKCRLEYVQKKYDTFIPQAIHVLSGNCEIDFRDSMLLMWSLAKAIENGGVYLESVKYRRKIEQLLPRYLKMYPTHVHYLANMSNFYYSQGKFKEAIQSYKKNLDYMVTHNEKHFMGTFSNSIGVCFNNLNEPDSAIKYFQSALRYYLQYNQYDSAYVHGLVSGNIAQSLMKKGDYRSAIPLLLQDIDGSRVIEPKNTLNSMLELANCYHHLGNISLANLYIDSINKFHDQTLLSYRVKLKILEVKSEVYHSSGHLDSANKCLSELIKIIKTNDREFAINQSNILLALYEVNEKQKIIDKQKIDNQNVQLELVAKSKNQILAIGVSIGILIILFVVLVAHGKVTKQKRKLQETNELNIASLEEKEVLLKEIHHRVKNNLQVVSGLLHLQSSKNDSPELLEIIEEGQQRIESMALIHQMLYQDDTDVSVIDCQDYFEQLTAQIEHSYGAQKVVSISIEASRVKLGFDTAIPLGLIINELTVNSFKYAFPNGGGEIKIELNLVDQDHFQLVFLDTGIGIKNIDSIESLDSLGLRLVRMFCEEMDAVLAVSNSPGATFEIFFKELKNNEGES